MRDKIIQLSSCVLLVLCMVGAGSLIHPILKQADESRLRYTNVSVEGAPFSPTASRDALVFGVCAREPVKRI